MNEIIIAKNRSIDHLYFKIQTNLIKLKIFLFEMYSII